MGDAHHEVAIMRHLIPFYPHPLAVFHTITTTTTTTISISIAIPRLPWQLPPTGGFVFSQDILDHHYKEDDDNP